MSFIYNLVFVSELNVNGDVGENGDIDGYGWMHLV